jgi:HAD superfamily hydrolase (TIGR01509 family)
VRIDGVLLDYSGTLFRLEITKPWPAEHGDLERVQRLMQALTAPVAPDEGLPADLVAQWEQRDLDPDIHRACYLGAMRLSGLTEPGWAEEAYEQLLDASNWQPYPDTIATLQRLRDNRIPVAVVSNIAWDIRGSFHRLGISELVNEFVLSYVEGSVKPDEKLFRVALERLGVEGAHALMIGDSRQADGGAAALGCQVEFVDATPTSERPDALLRALANHSL